MKKIDEKRPLKPQNFLGAFGADYLSSAYPDLDFINPPLLESVANKGGFNKRDTPDIGKSSFRDF